MNPTIRCQTLFELLHRSAARTPHKLAIACGDTRWSYAEFERVSERDQPVRRSRVPMPQAAT